jgi:hypothetical protein
MVSIAFIHIQRVHHQVDLTDNLPTNIWEKSATESTLVRGEEGEGKRGGEERNVMPFPRCALLRRQSQGD